MTLHEDKTLFKEAIEERTINLINFVYMAGKVKKKPQKESVQSL